MERQYVGKGRRVGKYGNIKIGIKPGELPVNERGYCNLIVAEMKQEDKYHNTHTVFVDTWKPGDEPEV